MPATSLAQDSPSSLAQLARERLDGGGYMTLKDVECEFSEGEARLCGRLPSYHLKQLAQEIVARIDGVRAVLNQIEVIRPTKHPQNARVNSAGGTAHGVHVFMT